VDYSDPSSVKGLYERLERVSRHVCDSGMSRAPSVEAADRACAAKALDEAVQHLNRPELSELHRREINGDQPALALATRPGQ